MLSVYIYCIYFFENVDFGKQTKQAEYSNFILTYVAHKSLTWLYFNELRCIYSSGDSVLVSDLFMQATSINCTRPTMGMYTSTTTT